MPRLPSARPAMPRSLSPVIACASSITRTSQTVSSSPRSTSGRLMKSNETMRTPVRVQGFTPLEREETTERRNDPSTMAVAMSKRLDSSRAH